jgi:ribosomal protein S27E
LATEEKHNSNTEPTRFRPALREVGTTDCPICRHRVVVFLTKTNRPFVNCSFCSARIFYNGGESMRVLEGKLKPMQASRRRRR